MAHLLLRVRDALEVGLIAEGTHMLEKVSERGGKEKMWRYVEICGDIWRCMEILGDDAPYRQGILQSASWRVGATHGTCT